jgi:hypothetical protein
MRDAIAIATSRSTDLHHNMYLYSFGSLVALIHTTNHHEQFHFFLIDNLILVRIRSKDDAQEVLRNCILGIPCICFKRERFFPTCSAKILE